MKLSTIVQLLLIFLMSSTVITASVHLPPTLKTTPDDLIYEVGTTGHDLIWVADAAESNDAPTVYIAKIDGEILLDHNEQPWENNVDIVVNVDGLAIGNYTVEIEIRDSGYPDNADPAFDEVKVSVVEEGAAGNGSDNGGSDNSDTGGNQLNFSLLGLVMAISLVSIYSIRRRR